MNINGYRWLGTRKIRYRKVSLVMINLWPLISNLLVVNGSIHSINEVGVIRTYNWKRAITVG